MINFLVGYPSLFPIGVIGCVLFGYFIIIQVRRETYRKLAGQLGFEYVSLGLFKTGQITGTRDGRKFMIQTDLSRFAGRWASSFVTTFSISCKNRGRYLLIRGNFFNDFPNWKAIFTIDSDKEKQSPACLLAANPLRPLTTINPMYITLREEDKPVIQHIFQGLINQETEFIKKGAIEIEKDKVIFTIVGIQKNANNIRQALAFLEKIAIRVESGLIINPNTGGQDA